MQRPSNFIGWAEIFWENAQVAPPLRKECPAKALTFCVTSFSACLKYFMKTVGVRGVGVSFESMTRAGPSAVLGPSALF